MPVKDRDLGWRDILKAATGDVKNSSVRVGILGNTERGGVREEGEALTVAEIAVVNEYGTEDGKIPSRPAHRMTFDRRREEIQREAFRALTKIVLDRALTVEQALSAMGLRHATEIRKTITEGAGVPPPNASSTLARKEDYEGGAKAREAGQGARTLVDTGRTINALSYAVEIGTDKQPAKYAK